jgi:hypothetical protein
MTANNHPAIKHGRITATREGAITMADRVADLGEHDKQHDGNSPVTIPETAIFSYNLDDSKTPGAMKVRWKVRVVTGPEAAC